MYYINWDQVHSRLDFIPAIQQVCETIIESPNQGNLSATEHFAQERALHLAIETVTDVGSLLIDGFIMRDASSYEDIIEILKGEQVFSEDIAFILLELVRLRRPLVQEYMDLERKGVHPLLPKIRATLPSFTESVKAFIKKELKQE